MCVYTTGTHLMFWKLCENYAPSKTLDNFFELWFCSAQPPFFGFKSFACVGVHFKTIFICDNIVSVLCFHVLATRHVDC